MRLVRHLAIACATLSAFAAAAVADDKPVMVSVIVPVVGSVTGPGGARWRTDVELRNDSKTDATVSLTLPTTPDQPVIVTTIPPGETIRFGDVVGEAFGMESALSPLIVETLGRRSVIVRATTYAVRGTEISAPQPIALQYGNPFAPIRVLNGLSFSDDFRTNVGLANLGEENAEFVLALQRLAGRNVAVSRIVVPPNSLVHAALQSLFPLITSGTDFSVLVETPSPNTYVYASVIENATDAARFVQPAFSSPLPEVQQQARQ
ncbi:MAG: hypothetical protein ACXV5L_09215 [Thermoanaerobaculia bacterium]